MNTTANLAVLADPYGHMWGDSGWVWLWGPLMMLVIVGAIITGVWLVVRSNGPAPPPSNDRAREILAERYARGDLSTEEYYERLDALK